jgi:hypothetical protein
MQRAPVLAVALVGIGIVLACLAAFGMRAVGKPSALGPSAIAPVWTETKWPFPVDQWGTGRAFACASSDCGGKVEVYIRPKVGFCNCSTGVSDEAELERVADTELLARDLRPLEPGRAIKVGWMRGLSRLYQGSDGNTGERVLSVAFNDECDVVVAVARFEGGAAAIAPAVVGFLNSNPMVLWAKKELGLEFVRREW